MADQADPQLQQLALQLQRILDEQERRTRMTREQQFWLLRRAIVGSPWLRAVLEEPRWQLSIRLAATQVPSENHEVITTEVAKRISAGDVLNVSYYTLPHKLVVESCRYSAADNQLAVRAIHYGRLRLLDPVTVLREDFIIDCTSSKAWLHTFPNSVLYSANESLARAKSRFGETQHHPTSNNAHSLAVWCRVRDCQRNKDDCHVPLQLHKIRPADHAWMSFCNRKFHAVVSEAKSLDVENRWLVLSIVAETSAVANLCAFTRSSFSIGPDDDDPLVRLHVPFQMAEVRQGVEKLSGACLSWECSDLQAIAFLATGVCAEPRDHREAGIEAAQLLPGYLISRQGRAQIVLSVRRKSQQDRSFRVETLQYGPLILNPAQATSEVHVVLDTEKHQQVHLIRHSEPDLQCPILRQWKSDVPMFEEHTVGDFADLQPGDAVCIRQKTDTHPFEATVPGLHAIVNKLNKSTDESSLEVICFAGDAMSVDTLRVSASGHVFSTLRFQADAEKLSTREQVLQRARARLGTAGYSAAWSSSRDLVRWCCVNHKSNSPRHFGPVTGISLLVTLPVLGQGHLNLQQDVPQSAEPSLQTARLLKICPCDECVDMAHLSLTAVTWQPKTVQMLTVSYESSKNCIRRVCRILQEPVGSTAQVLSDTTAILLGASLVNASDRHLGYGISHRDFCTWLRGLTRPGLVELAALLSASSNNASNQPADEQEVITDLQCLNTWDHIIVESGQEAPVHLLFTDAHPATKSLRGFTYAPISDYDPGKRLEMFVYFPLEKSPYPMLKVIERTPTEADESSELSSSLAATPCSPDDAASWAELCVRELESDLLLQPQHGLLKKLLNSMLKFAFRIAAGELRSDDESRLACIRELASANFAELVRSTVETLTEDAGRRLQFVVTLTACLLELNV